MDKIDKAAKEMNREIFLFFFVKSRFSLKKTPQTADQTFLSLKTKKKALNAHKAQTGLKLHRKSRSVSLSDAASQTAESS